jgi:hypothetical protein
MQRIKNVHSSTFRFDREDRDMNEWITECLVGTLNGSMRNKAHCLRASSTKVLVGKIWMINDNSS